MFMNLPNNVQTYEHLRDAMAPQIGKVFYVSPKIGGLILSTVEFLPQPKGSTAPLMVEDPECLGSNDTAFVYSGQCVGMFMGLAIHMDDQKTLRMCFLVSVNDECRPMCVLNTLAIEDPTIGGDFCNFLDSGPSVKFAAFIDKGNVVGLASDNVPGVKTTINYDLFIMGASFWNSCLVDIPPEENDSETLEK